MDARNSSPESELPSMPGTELVALCDATLAQVLKESYWYKSLNRSFFLLPIYSWKELSKNECVHLAKRLK